MIYWNEPLCIFIMVNVYVSLCKKCENLNTVYFPKKRAAKESSFCLKDRMFIPLHCRITSLYCTDGSQEQLHYSDNTQQLKDEI